MIYRSGIGEWSGSVLGKRGIRQSAATYMYYYDFYYPGCDSRMPLTTTPATIPTTAPTTAPATTPTMTPAPEIPRENHLKFINNLLVA